MIAVDTNILVYAHREESEFHSAARAEIEALACGAGTWAIPWPCVHEFLGCVTNPRIFRTPTPLDWALRQVAAWVSSPSLRLLGERDGYLDDLRAVLEKSRVAGPRVHDARVAALCRHHGVDLLLSADRDFSRFRGLVVRNPLLGR